MKKSLVFCLVCLLFLAACQYLPFQSSGSVVSGKGVKVEFVDYPSGKLGEGELFSVRTRVTNYNPSSPVQGQLCIADFVSKRLGGIPENTCQDFIVEKAEVVNSKVYEQAKEQIFSSYSYHDLEPNVPYTDNIGAIFTYSVASDHILEGLCVKTSESVRTSDVSASKCSKSESFSSVKQPDTPIRVTSITKDVNYLGNQQANVRLTIDLKKVEDGDVVSSELADSSANPFSAVPFIDFDLNYAGVPFECPGVNAGRLQFGQAEKEISCHGLVNVPGEFLSEPLVIRLGYSFRKTIQTPSFTVYSNRV